MSDNQMFYDFRGAIAALVGAQTDLVEIITKWREMLDSTPRYVEFTLRKGDRTSKNEHETIQVPNVQMIIDTINERTLPQNPSFHNVTTIGQGGNGTLTNGGLTFKGADVEGRYTVHGIENAVRVINADDSVVEWPLPRYWHVDATSNVNILVAPADWGNPSLEHASDFFVRVASGAKATLRFASYGQPQQMVLDAGAGQGVWHVVAFMANQGRAGRHMYARAVKMVEA